MPLAELLMPVERQTRIYQIRGSDSFWNQVERAAELKQISVSSYVRMVLQDRMKEDGVPPPKKPKPKSD